MHKLPHTLIAALAFTLMGCDPSSTASAPPPPTIPARSTDPPSTDRQSAPPSGEDAADLIRWLLADDRNTDQVPFATVVRATAGKQILPVDPEDPVTTEILRALRNALDETLDTMNAEDSPIRDLARINEASRYFEDEMITRLDATEGFSCGIPKRSDGTAQRSGYPDLRFVHSASGRVTYIDPKLFASTGKSSSLRTFYFEPKKRTNKILDDAHHILVGIEHDGNDGAWHFTAWNAIDLSTFQVRLKAEFQASNRDLYTPKLTIMQNPVSPAEE